MIDWIIDNKEWVFSGVGVALLTSVFAVIASQKKHTADVNKSQSIKGVNAGGNVTIKQTIGSDNAIPVQVQQTLMALRQMPSRIQKKIDAGETHIELTEALSEIEKLFVLASAKQDDSLIRNMMEIQERFNNYLNLLNKAASREITLNEVNDYHRSQLIGWFEDNIVKN